MPFLWCFLFGRNQMLHFVLSKNKWSLLYFISSQKTRIPACPIRAKIVVLARTLKYQPIRVTSTNVPVQPTTLETIVRYVSTRNLQMANLFCEVWVLNECLCALTFSVTNPCESNPCQNNGVCEDKVNSSGGDYIYECKCASRYTGTHCETGNPYSKGHVCFLTILASDRRMTFD